MKYLMITIIAMSLTGTAFARGSCGGTGTGASEPSEVQKYLRAEYDKCAIKQSSRVAIEACLAPAYKEMYRKGKHEKQG